MNRERRTLTVMMVVAALVAALCATAAPAGAEDAPAPAAPEQDALTPAPAPAPGQPATGPALLQAEENIPISVDASLLPIKGRLVDGRTMVSMKGFAGAMGWTVNTGDGESTGAEISDGARTISFDVNENTAAIGPHRMQVIPGAMVLDGQTYAPLRFMAENMGFRVVWDAATRSVALFRIEENPITIAIVEDVLETETLQINIQYPRIEGLENKEAETKFNQYFAEAAAACRGWGESMEKYVEDSQSSDDPRVIQVQSWMNYVIAYNRNDIVSVVWTHYGYTGGAHGLTVQSSYTMNIRTGQVYKIYDLFKSDADYVSLISDEVKRQIAALGQDIYLLQPFEEIRKDQDFYIKDEAVVVYFQLYEYTPYAYGIPEFAVDLKALEESLDPEFTSLIMAD